MASAVPHSLDPIFHPQTVAVLGARVTPGSAGSILTRSRVPKGIADALSG